MSKNVNEFTGSLLDDTYGDLEVSVVEEEGSVGARESILLFLLEGRYCNLSHFSYLIIIYNNTL